MGLDAGKASGRCTGPHGTGRCHPSWSEDPGGLGCQELPPGRPGPARRQLDTCGMQDISHGGRRNLHAELDELTMDPVVSLQRLLPRQADDKAADAAVRRRASRLAQQVDDLNSTRQANSVTSIPWRRRSSATQSSFRAAQVRDVADLRSVRQDAS